VAFPVGLAGLTRQGTDIYDGAVKVLTLQAPVVYDAAGDDTRPIKSELVKVGNQWYVLFTLPSLAGMASPVIDPTLTLQPNSDGIDTGIASGANSSNNYGTSPRLLNGVAYRGLLKFDCSPVPNGAICVSGTYSLFQDNSQAAGAFTLTHYSIASGNSAWIEGTKGGSTAGAGEPCWDYLGYNTVTWAGSAGLATSGTDYVAAAIGSVSGNRSDANGTEYAAALTASVVQTWFGTSTVNYGVKTTPSATMGAIGSSDNTVATRRPKLVVVYTVPGGIAPFSAPFQGAFG
jgi:hypothetical protein